MTLCFPKSGNGVFVSYIRNKVGINYFTVLYKNISQACTTPDQVKQCFGMAKSTPFVKELFDWCKDMDQQYGLHEEGLVSTGIVVAGGFGPECHQDNDPTTHTKMIV